MKKLLLGTTTLALFASAGSRPAQAQTTTAAQPQQVQEVVITAQKRPERLSTVTVSASVVSSQQLASEAITNIADLSRAVPSVSINGTTNGRVPYAMRGVSTTANEGNVGLNSGVAILLDGVSIPSDSHDADQIVDLERVEVLKGPQATLGGRAAASGVINMVTRGPSAKWTGQFDTTFTTDGEKRVYGYISGPLTPAFNFSLSGYGNQTPYPIENLYNGKHTTLGSAGLRGKLQYKPDALLTATLGAHFAQTESYGDNFVYTYLTPGSALLSTSLPPYVNFTPASLLPGVPVGSKNLYVNSIAPNTGSIYTNRDISLNIDYQLGDLDLGSITAYQDQSERDTQDLFDVNQFFFTELTQGGVPFNNHQYLRNHLQQTSQEFKIASPTDAQLSYLGGLYYSDEFISSRTFRALPPAAQNFIVKPRTATYDAYARVTYKITPQFSLVGGVRYNYDVLSYRQDQLAYAPFSPQYSAGSSRQGVWVGDVSAKYNFDANNMVYATYSHGYAPMAYNTATPLLSNAPTAPVKAMSIEDFEIGSKGRYLNGMATLNASAFYTIYNNYQIETYSDIPGLLNPPLVLANAPEAQTHGVEVDTTIRPTLGLTVNANAAYIDATFVKYDDAECWFASGTTAGTSCYTASSGVLEQNVSGKPLPNSPKFKFVLNANQEIPLNSIPYNVELGGTYTWQDRVQMLPDQSPYGFQNSYGLLDLDAGLESNTGTYSITVFVNNVTNKVYYTDIEDFWNTVWAAPNGHNETIIGQPGRDAHRYAGFRLSAKF